MPSPIQNKWTIRKLLNNTYHFFPSRFKYKLRDFVKVIKVKSISVYDGKAPGEARTKYELTSQSLPQYYSL